MKFNSAPLNPLENPLFPLALHPNDNPAVSIVLDPLNGSNFVSWSHVVKCALSVKKKVSLIGGSLILSSENDDKVIFVAWTRANDQVLMWILNFINHLFTS
ncbi:hypothetical protein ACS0TY_017090 [Phlomoides rotata]